MGEILILKSINGRILTDKLVDSWFDTNEMFVTKKSFSDDRCSVEVTFIDEERADMMSDLLSTCYGDYISISRPQTLNSSLDNSFEDERVPSPAHLSSAISVSSGISSFSRRLVALDKKTNDENVRLAIGRGRGIDGNQSQIDMLIAKENQDGSVTNDNSTSPIPSLMNSSISSGFGRGRGAVFK